MFFNEKNAKLHQKSLKNDRVVKIIEKIQNKIGINKFFITSQISIKTSLV